MVARLFFFSQTLLDKKAKLYILTYLSISIYANILIFFTL